MLRKSLPPSPSQQFLTIPQLIHNALSVLSSPSPHYLLNWQPEYLSYLIPHTLSPLYHSQTTTLFQKLILESLLAKCCWYHKETVKEVAEFFKIIDMRIDEIDRESVMQRLRTLNLLTLIEWFPGYLVKVPESTSIEKEDKMVRVYVENLRRFRGEEIEQIDEKECIDEIANLRDFLLDSQRERTLFLKSYPYNSTSFIVPSLPLSSLSTLYRQVTSHHFLILLTPSQQLPSQLSTLHSKIQIWVDKSIQFNSLIGNYVCSQKYGEFKWVNGPLIYALEQGLWLVLNNFQQASNQLIVAIKNIVNNGYLWCQSLGKVYAAAGFRVIGVSNQGVEDIETVSVEEKDPLLLLPVGLIERSREYLEQVLLENKKLGYSKLSKLWKRIEYVRKQFVKSQYECEVVNIWQGSITAEFKEIVREEVDQINNRFFPKTVDYVKRGNEVKIGKVTFKIGKQTLSTQKQIVLTQYSLRIMQKISMGIQMDQPILLVSETGCGKTTLIQHLAKLRGKKLYVINMNIGSQASDLIGGFKPLDFKYVYDKIVRKFRNYFEVIKTKNSLKFENKFLEQYGREENYLNVLKLIQKNIEPMKKRYQEYVTEITPIHDTNHPTKLLNWSKLEERVNRFIDNFDIMKNQLVFSFVQGNLLKALKNGDWILIDEINLAGNEVLQKLVPLVTGNSLLMYEKGDMKIVPRHPDFRLFGCMNPGNDHGKKQLPKNLQDKFTILELPEPEKEDIRFFIESKCPAVKVVSSDKSKEKLEDLYFKLKAKKTISLRNLSRALNYVNSNISIYGERAKYDGLVLGFGQKEPFVSYYEKSKLLKKQGYIQKFDFLIEQGPYKVQDTTFKITTRFQQHIKDLLRAVAGTDLPVMLQGPTSAGKTSMVRYLAAVSGHKCIRINNHQHTDVEEYLGTYYPSKTGQLVFREGPLVEAVRNGYWLILDELNLARSQILECLNRLLDDNKELFLPEIQETLKPHPHFRIFATQNPASYSGRKILSKAFRNRFVQLEMGEISTEETIQILQQRVPFVEHSEQIRRYLTTVLNSLTQYRLREKIFIKDAVITIRDLLKWTGRTIDTSNLKENFAMQGFTVIGERLRTMEEKQYVKSVLCNSIGSKKVGGNKGEKKEFDEKQHYKELMERLGFGEIESIRLNSSFTRMTALTMKALENRQPVLLIGETGCGKTTLAELLAKKFSIPFFSINCHKHIQASDFLGCLRPNPHARQLGQSPFLFVNGVLLNALIQGGLLLIDQINTAQDSVLERMNQVLEGGLTIGVQRGEGWQVITAHPNFRIIATMNPSGDFGKKQLSPALRNRFTEIWVQPVTHPASLQQYKQVSVEENDVLQMILKEMRRKGILEESIAWNLFNLVCNFNIEICEKYSIQKRTLTMRDIVWIINFIYKSQHITHDIITRFHQALHILLIEGVEFLPLTPESKVLLRQQLLETISLPSFNPFNTLLQLDFPILISTNLPLHLIPIPFQQRIFFNIYTQLSDILGQYRPEGNIFKWYDGPLLSAVKQGRTVALIDLNLAQQQVIQGINSLFDYRGSIFVVDLDTTYQKHKEFKPVVVLKTKIEGDRKMLPNSFLNRFVKLHLGEFGVGEQIEYLKEKYEGVEENVLGKIGVFVEEEMKGGRVVKLKELELFCELYLHTRCLKRSLKIAFLSTSLSHLPTLTTLFSFPSLHYLPTRQQQHLISHLPLLHQTFSLPSLPHLSLLLQLLLIYTSTSRSILLKSHPINLKPSHKLSLTRAFSWLLNLNFTHILLANNTDSAELLGSYQQCEINGEPVFQYQESRLVKALGKENMVYVEVFDDKMVERIEKGVEGVYDRRERVVMGCDGGGVVETGAVEFGGEWYVEKGENSRQSIHKVVEILNKSNNVKSLPPNVTNLPGATKYLTQLSMNQLINDIAKGVLNQSVKLSLKNKQTLNDNPTIQKILTILQYVSRSTQNQLDPYFNLLNYLHEIKQTTITQLTLSTPLKYSISPTPSMISYSHNYTLLSLSPSMPKTFQQYKLQCIIKYLFQLDSMVSDQLIRLFTYDEQVLLREVKRVFQRLYIVNVGGFREMVVKMLRGVKGDRRLLEKVFEEMMGMAEGKYKDYLIHLEESLDNEFIKQIPILTSTRSILHYITDLLQQQSQTPSYPILSILNLINYDSLILPQYSSIMPSHQSQVFEVMCEMKSGDGFGVVGEAIANTSMKNTKLFDVFNGSFGKVEKGRRVEVGRTVEELMGRLSLEDIGDRRELGTLLLDMFKPRLTLSQNICYFESNYHNHNILTSYHQFQQIFFSVQKYLTQIRCGEFQPSFIKHLDLNLKETEKQLLKLESFVVYRGPDNVNELKYFFENMMNQYEILEESGLTKEGIFKFIKQMYIFYDRFKDILLPLLTSLILLLPQQTSSSNIFLLHCHKPSMPSLIHNFTIHQLPSKLQQDNAKRHMLLQRKLHQMVIDQYTQQGVQHHKDQEQEDFKENFRPELMRKGEEPLDKIFGYFREDRMDYYHMAMKELERVERLEELAVWMSLVMKERRREELNIYAETSIDYARAIIDELYNILKHLKSLLTTFNTQQTRALCLLINAILNLKVFKTEIYQLLQGCQHIVNKLAQLNTTLPKSLHIPTQPICFKIIELRKIQMRNWAKMITTKQHRVQKNDLVEFVELWRMAHDEENKLTEKEMFMMSDRYVRESRVGTYVLRREGLECVGGSVEEWVGVMKVHEFYSYFEEDHKEMVKELKDGIEKEIKEYKQLAGWKSTNYLILKSTSEKFQRSIHKILKRYEDSLKTPFLTIIQKKRQSIFASSLEQYHQRFAPTQQPINTNNDNYSQYEQLIASIFSSIDEMKSDQHSNKSRMTTVDQYSKEIQEMIENFTDPIKKLHTDTNFVPDFSHIQPQYSHKMKKYYYGIWDKFNQRNQVQGKWQIDKIDKLWKIIQNGWKYLNHWIYQNKLVMQGVKERVNEYTNVSKLLKPYGWSVDNLKEVKGHPLFEKEVREFNQIVKERYHKEQKMIIEYQNVQQICGFMKLLYICSRIILNLQKSGFCVKDKQQQQQGEGEGELTKQGMGLGQADADKQAENIADEIEFEEQLQGLKGEKQGNQDNMDDKDKEKDFEMENDFNAEAEDIQKNENEEEEQEKDEEKMDEGFGEVGKQDENEVDQGQDSEREDDGENKKEQDLQFKTDKKAGEEDEIKAKEDKKDKKDQRNLGEDQFKAEEGDEGEEDSDMGPGEKLDEMEEQEVDLENDEGEGEGDGDRDDMMEIQSEDERDDRELQEKDDDENKDGENEELSEIFQHKNQDKSLMQQQLPLQQDQQNPQGQSPQQPPQKPQIKSKPKPKKATPAYGVQGDQKNPLLNGQQQQKNQELENNNEGENAKGKDDDQKDKERRERENMFSRELIEEIMEANQQKGNQEFRKNLNVTEGEVDEEKEGVDGEEEENKDEKEREEDGEQYGLSKDSKLKTNLTSKEKPNKVEQAMQQQQENLQDEQKIENEKRQHAANEKKQQIEEQKKPIDTKKNNRNQPDNNLKNEEIQKPKKEKRQNQPRDNNIRPMQVEQPIPHEIDPDNILPLDKMNQYLESNRLPQPQLEPTYLLPDDQLISSSQRHSHQLYQQLKAVLQPQQIASYQGDYKTGKKLNMRKIIQFIASQYRKDRIWLRRAEPTDRNYQIMIGIDDTKSMALNEVGKQALEGSFALAFALARLNIKIGISRMNENTTLLHPFEQMFTQPSAKQIIQKFSFSYQSPKSRKIVMNNFMRDSLFYFLKQKQKSSNDQTEQLCFIVSDGHFDKADVLTYLKQAKEKGITYIYIIIDNEKNSIMNIKTAVMRKGEMRYDTKGYMNDFPFEYYLVVKDVKELSEILGEVLRQYFEQR